MPSHIVVNSLGLTYKGTIGISTATIPDVCKTPSPGGPVPIPYPNIARQSSLKSGTTTVKAKGKMIAVKGSQFGSSNGDEAGTAGGVKSNVNMKATDWITYSFDVKMDGKNACRHTDKKFHNNKNTVDLAGEVDPLTPAELDKFREVLCRFLKECTDEHDAAQTPTEDWCKKSDANGKTNAQLRGTAIDECVSKKVKDVKRRSKSNLANQTFVQTGLTSRGHICKPDFFLGRPPNIQKVFDIKTSCPPGKLAPDWPIYSPTGGPGLYQTPHEEWHGSSQEEIYAEAANGAPVDMVHEETCK